MWFFKKSPGVNGLSFTFVSEYLYYSLVLIDCDQAKKVLQYNNFILNTSLSYLLSLKKEKFL